MNRRAFLTRVAQIAAGAAATKALATLLPEFASGGIVDGPRVPYLVGENSGVCRHPLLDTPCKFDGKLDAGWQFVPNPECAI